MNFEFIFLWGVVIKKSDNFAKLDSREKSLIKYKYFTIRGAKNLNSLMWYSDKLHEHDHQMSQDQEGGQVMACRESCYNIFCPFYFWFSPDKEMEYFEAECYG